MRHPGVLAPKRDDHKQICPSRITRALQITCAICFFLAFALLLSRLLVMAAGHSSLHLPRRFLHENMNAGMLVAMGFGAASGVLLLIVDYKCIVTRGARLLRLGEVFLEGRCCGSEANTFQVEGRIHRDDCWCVGDCCGSSLAAW
jgi:hypothetical protein